jgi:hypothetical protein
LSPSDADGRAAMPPQLILAHPRKYPLQAAFFSRQLYCRWAASVFQMLERLRQLLLCRFNICNKREGCAQK